MAEKTERGFFTSINSTVDSSMLTIENTMGIVSDALEIGRENLRPELFKARTATVLTMKECLEKVEAEGLGTEELKAYVLGQ